MSSPGLCSFTYRRRNGRRVTLNRIERLISRGESNKACQYIITRATRQALSVKLAKRDVALKAFDAFLKHGAEAEARTLQFTLLNDATANVDHVPEGYYSLLFLCLFELTLPIRISERKQEDWRVRAHHRILLRAQPLLRDLSADELARALGQLALVQHAGAQLCLALAGAYAQIHGDDSLSHRLGIQIARVAAEKLVRGDEAPMPWAARALKSLQRTSRLEHNLPDAHHARRLRALYEERAKGKGPLEPVTFTLDELVKDNEGADVPELSEIQLDLLAEGARMSLLATTLAQREDGEGPSSSERRTFRSIGSRLAAFSRADFEQMSEVELDDLITRQEQYMKMTSLFSAGPLRDVAAREAQATGAEATTQSDAPARVPENGIDTCTVAKPVQAVGSTANSSDTVSGGDVAAPLESAVDSPVSTSQPSASPKPTPDSLEKLVDKAIAFRGEFASGVVDQRGLDESTATRSCKLRRNTPQLDTTNHSSPATPKILSLVLLTLIHRRPKPITRTRRTRWRLEKTIAGFAQVMGGLDEDASQDSMLGAIDMRERGGREEGEWGRMSGGMPGNEGLFLQFGEAEVERPKMESMAKKTRTRRRRARTCPALHNFLSRCWGGGRAQEPESSDSEDEEPRRVVRDVDVDETGVGVLYVDADDALAHGARVAPVGRGRIGDCTAH
ncbi:hypothetical protein PENSPDRAFT_688701 [Peniophora sp. CONT]|nr:hypothetical protein PENSPDRAFT_688701 [Peniophora sp. CONT]